MTGRNAPIVQWVTGSPLWSRAITAAGDGDRAAMLRPALLRFGSDTFMDDLAGILQARPGDLEQHVARPRSFRPAPPGAPADWPPPPAQLKLYQPVHGDFNLVAASLICRMPGMPDHTVRPAEAEKVGFVVRRLQPAASAADGAVTELAWVSDPAGQGKQWLPVTPGREEAIAAGEEILPMFPAAYRDGQQPRRLFVGLVPVASGETFTPTAAVAAFPPRPVAGPARVPDVNPRWDEFDTRVIRPLAAIRDPDLPAEVTPEQREEASAMLLVDFADLLQRYLPSVWQALPHAAGPPGAKLARLVAALGTPADAARGLTWRQALQDAWLQRLPIFGESDATPALRCDLRRSTLVVRLAEVGDAPGPGSLQAMIRDALGPALQPAAGQGAPPGLPVPKLEPTGETTYRIRCVYRRPKCDPFPTDLVSLPTDRFAIAPLFDPDAPARQIRISLPVDTDIRDLRKFRKNVGFLLSNQLRSQLDRITDPKKALNGDLGDETRWDLGVLCQLSIPIITICALVVLMIFLSLLNIVFFWQPFFRICLPIPLRSRR